MHMKPAVLLLRDPRAFSLVELLLYVGILGIVGGLLTGILTTATKTQIQQTSQDKLSGELSFAMSTIQRLVQQSSVIDADAGTASSGLKLRMENLAQDPTLVYLNNGTIYIQQGSSTPQALTDDQVSVSSLQFKKFSQHPGKDVVQIDIAMTDASNPNALARSLRSAVSRASAATFDSDLIPGTSNSYSVGVSGNTWKNAQFSGIVGIAPGGQLGIGTLNPSYPLDIETADNGIFVSSTATSSNNFLLNLQAGTSTAFYVRNDGNIGIGTSTPAYGLDIYNSFHVAGTSTFDGNIVFGGSTDAPTYRISNVATPTISTDVATKGYVDANAGGSGIVGIVDYTTPGTYTWTKPTNVSSVVVEVVGGGGGGGYASTYSGSGGGSGGYCKKFVSLLSGITSLQIVVGAGGAGGTSGSGSAGGTSSVGGVCSANGGGGGVGGLAYKTVGGIGGTASGGDLNITGNTGNTAGNLYGSGGSGAGSYFGGGGVGGCYSASGCPSGSTSGSPGSSGGGGGGAGSGSGGAGGNGIVVITEYE